MLFRMVSNAYIPSLVAFGDVVPNGTKMVPNLVWLIFLLFSTAFSCNIFRLDQQHRKILFSQSADFVIFSDITNKMADASDILYISTALHYAIAYKQTFLFFHIFFTGAAFGPVKIGIARPVMEENNEAVMNQLRERLSAADNTANTPLPPSTEDVSSKLLFLTEMKAFITISFLSERTLQQPL